MVKKVNHPDQPNESAAQAADDLAVLFPDQNITLQGQTITVTEYPFMTWLALKPSCTDIIQQFAAFFRDDVDVKVDDIFECFEDNFDSMKHLLSESIHQPEAFLAKLSDSEMNTLFITWWMINKHFFLQSAYRLVRKSKTPSDGQTSSSA
ncbi:DUF6631 family protein [Acinetobacter bereziniae]|uniref:DUF6631 family protein n=1 Tax=Acinetobacter bereziniae TaxID=106648 RepID=UPI000EF647EC|nr:DUF6631 family protein [Acinetobacter bereziniae]MBJ8477172.1 hypothetical protein [Acinetobacter bereziniae]